MKKVLALVLVAMMVLSIAPMAFAATKDDVTSIGLSRGGSAVTTTSDIDLGTYYVGDAKLRFDLVDKNGAALYKNDVRDLKIDVKARGGSGVLDSVKIKYDSGTNLAYIEVAMKDPFVSTGDKDFEIIITPVVNKYNLKADEITLIGNFKNPDGDDLDDSYEYANFDKNNRVRKSVDYIKKIELDVDGHLSIFTKLFADKKYYARATNKIKDEDADLFVTYPELDAAYYLETVGLNSVGNYVKLDLDDKNLFVYDGDLNYLGTSADELPVLGKYFVASAELDVADDVEEAPEDEAGIEDEAGSNPNMGGDDVPVNVNDNPGTGC